MGFEIYTWWYCALLFGKARRIEISIWSQWWSNDSCHARVIERPSSIMVSE
jgi:hypothetical protein